MVPTFIVCAPRSGTTWLVQALGALPDVYATELRAFGHHVDLVEDAGAARPRLRITLDRYVDALLAHHLWAAFGATREQARDDLERDLYVTIARHALARSGKRLFVDKVTPYAGTSELTVASIVRMFPDARLILLLRDGRDVAVSGVMHWLSRSVAGESLAPQQAERRAFFRGEATSPLGRLFTDAEIAAWAAHWREPIDALKTQAGGATILTVRYEDMSRDLGGEVTRICQFIGATADAAAVGRATSAASFESMSGGRRRGEDAPGAHVRKGVVGDWRLYFTREDAEAFDRVAGETLRSCGYERDASWIDARPAQLNLPPWVRAH